MITGEFERVSLPLADDFTISRGTQEEAENVVVRLTDEGGMTGHGAAAPSPHYGETVDTVEAVLPALVEEAESVGDPHAIERIEHRMEARVRRNPAARAAVSIALHDLAAKRLGVPLYRLWGLDADECPLTSFTIGLDSVDRVREKTEDAVDAGYPVLKLKLGTERDEELLEAVREAAPDATLRVDANEAWTPREAVEKSSLLAEHDVEFVEQPVTAEHPDGLRYVYERSAVPVAVDESVETLADVPQVADCCDVVNLKLMKCGGLREARRMIHAARAHGLEVMLGCMVETNAAIAAACHLAPLLDYADLDGALLLAADEYDGLDLSGGEIRLPDDRSGTGAEPR
ncbi:dipeptide epimerase [Salinigranum rubrum]|uniref:Dipeptide epimerase n=1 Tax=Salinigranum rubrum TaxID=755307 RepID=A0A2I8VM82_9EURY|nr:dipeptide epimerase [Salinigranum rubrum]AUV83005.1 dipeptide epimerase [Salinigranum rubrum]